MQIKGKHVILGIIAATILSTGGAILYNARITRRCLELWGTENVRLIQFADQVELVEFEGPDAVGSRDISQARGLIHLRAAILVDRTFDWEAQAEAPPVWKYALRFTDEAQNSLLIPFSSDFRWIKGPAEQVVSTSEMSSGFATFLGEHLDETGSLIWEVPSTEAETPKTPSRSDDSAER